MLLNITSLLKFYLVLPQCFSETCNLDQSTKFIVLCVFEFESILYSFTGQYMKCFCDISCPVVCLTLHRYRINYPVSNLIMFIMRPQTLEMKSMIAVFASVCLTFRCVVS